MTRSAKNWASLPGNFDTLHLYRRHYQSSNQWGFPDLLPQQFIIPHDTAMMSFRSKETVNERHALSLCHFFLDDYAFESVWNKPDVGVQRALKFWAALTPDFSLYSNWPPVAQMWNHYRRQWIGRYWQEHGINVIPTVNWSNAASFQWCFKGIPLEQTVALAVPDLRKGNVRKRFISGMHAMNRALHPSSVLVYGKLPDEIDILHHTFPPDVLRLRKFNKRTPREQTAHN